MQQSVKTYAVIVNMDYSKHPDVVCKEVWSSISQKMLDEDFHFEKRMFLLTTTEKREFVCEKARFALENLDGFKDNFKEKIYHYVKDFYAIDLTGHTDLIFTDRAKSNRNSGMNHR